MWAWSMTWTPTPPSDVGLSIRHIEHKCYIPSLFGFAQNLYIACRLRGVAGSIKRYIEWDPVKFSDSLIQESFCRRGSGEIKPPIRMASDSNVVRVCPIPIVRWRNPADPSYEGGGGLQHGKQRQKCNEQVGGRAHCRVEFAVVVV